MDLHLDHLSLVYPDGDTTLTAVDDVTLTVPAGTTTALLGPSGAGKSSLLAVAAGLTRPTTGHVAFGEEVVLTPTTGRAEATRLRLDRIGIVFQSPQLLASLTALEQLELHAHLRGRRPASAREEAMSLRDAVGLAVQAHRRPAHLSGGQRQRVAIGRALVKEPKLFLLDEPLSNLDAALRLRTRVELAQLKQRVDAAVIMVTHDQAEAMTLADRIVVMNDRKIQQVGPPMEIYSRPANTFVAQFVGSPAMTLAHAQMVGTGDFAKLKLGDGTEIATQVRRDQLPQWANLRVGLRPEAVRVGGRGKAAPKAKVDLVERLGERTLIYARLSDGQPITAEDEGDSRVKIGDQVPLKIDGGAAHVFDSDGTGYHGTAA